MRLRLRHLAVAVRSRRHRRPLLFGRDWKLLVEEEKVEERRFWQCIETEVDWAAGGIISHGGEKDKDATDAERPGEGRIRGDAPAHAILFVWPFHARPPRCWKQHGQALENSRSVTTPSPPAGPHGAIHVHREAPGQRNPPSDDRSLQRVAQGGRNNHQSRIGHHAKAPQCIADDRRH